MNIWGEDTKQSGAKAVRYGEFDWGKTFITQLQSNGLTDFPPLEPPGLRAGLDSTIETVDDAATRANRKTDFSISSFIIAVYYVARCFARFQSGENLFCEKITKEDSDAEKRQPFVVSQ
jgi:hypothetical protein